MFYSNFVYIKDGPLAKVWLASHMMRKLDAKAIRDTDICFSIKAMRSQKAPLALRLCGQLLLGLARIYEQQVKQVSEDATDILNKIKQMMPEANPRARRRKLADGTIAEAVEAAPERLRAREGAITNAAALLDATADMSFASLGGGFADADLDAMLDDPDGLMGEQLHEALDGMGRPHMLLNLETGTVDDFLGSGALALTQQTPYAGSTQGSRIGVEEDEEPLEHDANEPDLDDLMADVSGGRDMSHQLDLASEAGGLLDVSDARSINSKIAGQDASMVDDMGFGDGGGGLDLDLDGGVGMDGAASVHDAAAVDALLEQTEAELLKLQRAKRDTNKAAAASRKRAKNAYVPQVDDVTELSSATLKQWLADPSDILVAARPPRQAVSRVQKHIEWVSEHLCAELRLPGLRYDERMLERLAQAPAPVAPATPLGAGVPGDLSRIGDEELDFGAGGGFDDGVFGADTQLPDEHAQGHGVELDFGDEPAAEAEAEAAEDGPTDMELEGAGGASVGEEFAPTSPHDGDFEQLRDGRPVYPGKEASAHKRELWCERDEAHFWSEGDYARDSQHSLSSSQQSASGSGSAGSRSSVASGWSKRTVTMHGKLVDAFATAPKRAQTAAAGLLLSALVADRSPNVGATAFYQTLVLASGGYVRPLQSEPFAQIHIAKMPRFDEPLPSTGSQLSQTRKR